MRRISFLRPSSALCLSLTTALIFGSATCFAQTPEADIEELTVARSPLGTSGDQSTSGTSAINLNLIDQKLALSLAVDTAWQIQVAEVALKSVKSESLRTMLQSRLADQRAFAEHLEVLTGGRARQAIEQAAREIERDAAAGKAQPVRFRPLALQRNATAMMIRIRLEILQEYQELMDAELNTASSSEFDRQFLRHDLLHQMQMLAMLEVFEAQASADFAGVIAAQAIAARQHLDGCRQALSDLNAQPLAGASATLPSNAVAAP